MTAPVCPKCYRSRPVDRDDLAACAKPGGNACLRAQLADRDRRLGEIREAAERFEQERGVAAMVRLLDAARGSK